MNESTKKIITLNVQIKPTEYGMDTEHFSYEIAHVAATKFPLQPLTMRELEVLFTVAMGMTNKEIGNALVIAEPTVEAHMRNIFNKLGVYNRTLACTLAILYGLITINIEDSNDAQESSPLYP